MTTYDTIDVAAHPIKTWTRGVPVEQAAREQLINIANLPFVHGHVAVMPDVHLGKGATVGSVIATRGAIVPAAVGVDIGCGMVATQTNLVATDLPDSLRSLRDTIESLVPVGMDSHREPPRAAEHVWYLGGTRPLLGLKTRYERIEKKHPKIALTRRGKDTVAPVRQVGTLGGGNHFIEVCLDESDHLWIFLHSGSRGVGNRIGSYFIERAKERFVKHDPRLVADRDLAWLDEHTPEFGDYVEAVGWAQDYAAANRHVMLARTLEAVATALNRDVFGTGLAVNCHHNYISQETHLGERCWVTRKGAVRAGLGELGLIPGSMGQRSYVVKGLGNAESFESCSHGAGRAMSRSAAKRVFTLEDHVRWTEGVECRKDAGVLDEVKGAYKDIDDVMAAQRDLCEPIHELRAVLCVKG